jgi:hedgehog
MKDLAIGDEVQVVWPDGSLGFEDIYLFTHKDSQEITRYLRIKLESDQSLTLSPRHFVPVQGSRSERWANHSLKAADEIKVGELIWNRTETGVIRLAAVAAIEEVKEAGVFNPLTFSGTIVVDGVAASVHSDWFLDGLVSVSVQDRVYQALFAPLRLIYRVIGPAWARRIAEDWGVVDFVREKTMRQIQMLA